MACFSEHAGSGAEEGEAACRGRRGGGSASPTNRGPQTELRGSPWQALEQSPYKAPEEGGLAEPAVDRGQRSIPGEAKRLKGTAPLKSGTFL